jgi:hypothetical protein
MSVTRQWYDIPQIEEGNPVPADTISQWLRREEVLAASVRVRDLGGSRHQTPDPALAAAGWVDALDAREQLLSTATAGMTRQAVVWFRTSNTGTSVKWRIVKEDDDTVVLAGGDATEYSADTIGQRSVVALTIATTGVRWKLQLRASNSTNPVYVMGQFEEFVEPA